MGKKKSVSGHVIVKSYDSRNKNVILKSIRKRKRKNMETTTTGRRGQIQRPQERAWHDEASQQQHWKLRDTGGFLFKILGEKCF